MAGTLLSGKLPCPTCGSSDAWHVYDDGDGRIHSYCFSCNTWLGDQQSRHHYDGASLEVVEPTKVNPHLSPLKIFLSEIENSS